MHKNKPADNKLFQAMTLAKELPAELASRKPNSDAGCWVWASKEAVDTTGDMILVDGISFAEFHNPAEGVNLKMLAQHQRSTMDGKPCVVGLVRDWAVTQTSHRGKPCKGLAVYFEWLCDKEGKLLPLASEYKAMVDSGGIDQASVGIVADDYEWKDWSDGSGGWMIKKCSIFELSLVTIAANQGAAIIKSEDAGNLSAQIKAIASEQAKTQTSLQSLVDGISALAKSFERLNALDEKLEAMESALVVLASVPNRTQADPKTGSAEALAALRSKLEQTLAFLG